MQGCFNLMPPKEWKDFLFGMRSCYTVSFFFLALFTISFLLL